MSKKRLVFEYDDAVHSPVGVGLAFFNLLHPQSSQFFLRGRIEDTEPEKPEPNLAEALELFRELEKMCNRVLGTPNIGPPGNPPQPEPLKPCPFCKGEKVEIERDSFNNIRWVVCQKCGAKAPNVSDWNRRAS